MPIYEYACEHCNHHLEVMQKISEEPLKQCPNCKEDSLVKLISAAGFRLKGGGWYETDFKESDKKRNLVTNDSEAPRSDSKEGDSKTKNVSEKTETKSDSTGKQGESSHSSVSSNTNTSGAPSSSEGRSSGGANSGTKDSSSSSSSVKTKGSASDASA